MISARKKISRWLIGLLFVFGVAMIYIRLNPHYKTDIFRSFAKGNWYLFSEQDTLYAMGYYGVRKYLASDPKNLILLAENDEFTSARIIARGGCVHGQYLYMTTRSFTNNSSEIGSLVVLQKDNLESVRKIDSDMKLVEVQQYLDRYLLVSGIGGFIIFDAINPSNPKEIFSYKHHKHREYQGFDFFENDNKLYVAFAHFAEGIGIWELDHSGKATAVTEISLNDSFLVNQMPFYQTMDVIVDYPHLYATYATQTEKVSLKSDRRGLLVADLSDLDNIANKIVLIPASDWYHKTTGDRQPSYLKKFENNVYLNFAEKGVAIFDVSNPDNPYYSGTNDLSNDRALIQPIDVTDDGKLFTGSYYWKTIYGMTLGK